MISKKQIKIFECKTCNYACSKKWNYERHILTEKHKLCQDINKPMMQQIKNENKKLYDCSCGKIFNHRQSLSHHKKICKEIFEETDDTKEQISHELILELIQQNKELQQSLVEQGKEFQQIMLDQGNKMYELIKEGKHITNKSNTVNNNHFNLNLFLNEKCGQAINLFDFVDNIELKLSDLEETTRLGYAEGITKIFVRELNELKTNDRPIHCSDFKREILYIRNNNVWTKEDDNKSNITKAIKIIGNKNINQISIWQKEYPEYSDPSSKQNDKYLKMIYNAMNGATIEEQKLNTEKIIHNIAKEVVINKSLL